MKMRSVFCFLLVLVLMASGCLSAGAEEMIRPMVASVQSLLFSTENVTLSGRAVFSLGGERFKTAEILYKQDGADSHWQLDLQTPRPYRSDRATGFTVIANGEKIYVMERYYPGVYKSGSDQPNNTVLRRSLQADQLFSLALDLADSLESLLPADALKIVSDTPEGREFQLALSRETAPDLLNTSLNIAAGYVLRRFMNVDYDRENPQSRSHFADYPTETLSIIYATDSFVLGDTSVRVRLDADSRLSSVSGTVSALLAVSGESEKQLQIDFELSVYDYGKTTVPPFDPDLFQVVPADSGMAARRDVDPDLAARLHAAALEILKAANRDPGSLYYGHVEENDGFYYVFFINHQNEQETVVVTLNEDGKLLAFADGGEPYYYADARESSVLTLTEEECRPLYSFLQQGFPEMAARCSHFCPIMEYSYDGVDYLYVTAVDEGGEDTDVVFILRMEPELKIAAYHIIIE